MFSKIVYRIYIKYISWKTATILPVQKTAAIGTEPVSMLHLSIPGRINATTTIRLPPIPLPQLHLKSISKILYQ